MRIHLLVLGLQLVFYYLDKISSEIKDERRKIMGMNDKLSEC